MRRGWRKGGLKCGGLGLVAVAALVAGCSASNTTLPDTASMPTRASAAADRERYAKSLDETAAAAGARQSEAIKKIEGSR